MNKPQNFEAQQEFDRARMVADSIARDLRQVAYIVYLPQSVSWYTGGYRVMLKEEYSYLRKTIKSVGAGIVYTAMPKIKGGVQKVNVKVDWDERVRARLCGE